MSQARLSPLPERSTSGGTYSSWSLAVGWGVKKCSCRGEGNRPRRVGSLDLVHTGVFTGTRVFTGIREKRKNGKRSKTKLVTEGRVGDRPNGKSQYKSDFGSSWKKAKCGESV